MSHTSHPANDSLGNACLCNDSIICLICKCPKMQNAFGLPRPVNRSIKSKPLKVKAQTWIEIAQQRILSQLLLRLFLSLPLDLSSMKPCWVPRKTKAGKQSKPNTPPHRNACKHAVKLNIWRNWFNTISCQQQKI